MVHGEAMRFLILLLAILPIGLQGSPYRAVFITDADVASLGAGRSSLPRRHLAAAVAAAGRADAKAVVLKFFIDRPSENPADDNALAAAINDSKVPVILQANVESSESVAIPLPARLHRPDLPAAGDFVKGNAGWIPRPMFMEGASAVGFIDGLNPAPIVEAYQGRTVPSLFLVALEVALGKASVTHDTVTFGSQRLPMKGGKISLPSPRRDDLRPISLSELLEGSLDYRLKGAVIILGYDGQNMDTAPTPIGRIKKHRLFFYELELAYASFTRAPVE